MFVRELIWGAFAEQAAPPRRGAPLELRAEGWPEYFRGLARGCEGVLVTVEVVGECERLDRRHVRKRRLRTIGYRPQEDVLELAVDGCTSGGAQRYFIPAPRRIQFHQAGAGAELHVYDARGTRSLIRLFNLPSSLAGLPRRR